MLADYLGRAGAAGVITGSWLLSWFALEGKTRDRRDVRCFAADSRERI